METGEMAIRVQFYQKPGCINNRKQLNWLREAGIEPQVEDLLSTQWTAVSLRPFFTDKPVADWFNRTAPAVKQGEIVPAQLDESAALAAMLANPVLIRRPLICAQHPQQAQRLYMSGFDLAALLHWLGQTDAVSERVPSDIEICSKHPGAPSCATPVTGDTE
jgi:nitrogenase-associated protein